MKRRKTGIRRLVTWCFYVPKTQKVIGFYGRKKDAKRDHMPAGAVIVKMQGTYAVPSDGHTEKP